MATQCSQTPQGSTVGPPVPSGPMQFRPLAMIRAVVVLPIAAHAGHDEGLRDPVGLEGVVQRAHHRVLADQVGEGLGPVFARENLVGGFAFVGHAVPLPESRRI